MVDSASRSAWPARCCVIGVVDYAYQRWQFERSLHMTQAGIEGRSQARGRRPADQGAHPQAAARERPAQDVSRVPAATVVVTNPTHLAIALRYEPGMTAPEGRRQGGGARRQAHREIARGNGVPVVERKPLAQALFKAVKVDQEIPLGLYLGRRGGAGVRVPAQGGSSRRARSNRAVHACGLRSAQGVR